jgi:NADP-dependent 3-hydroxy acid dehydrogenase YdfG
MAGKLNVLVTGASSGIGKATAVAFATRGHTVFASARRDDALASLAATTPNLSAVGLDVTDEQSVADAWEKVQAQTGGNGVDVLVNNAGYALTGPIELLSDAAVKRQFDTNVFGLLTLTRTVLPSMYERRSGVIINLSSMVGLTTFPGMGIYGATKYAVEAVSDALRQEVSGFGVKVVIIEPGFVATSIGEASALHGSNVEMTEAYAEMARRGNAYLDKQISNGIRPEVVANTIVGAAERRRPRTRYVVPARMRALTALLTTLPDSLADRMKAQAIGR